MFVVCSSRLLIFAGTCSLYCYQYGPRSDCSHGSSQRVCFHNKLWSIVNFNICIRCEIQTHLKDIIIGGLGVMVSTGNQTSVPLEFFASQKQFFRHAGTCSCVDPVLSSEDNTSCSKTQYTASNARSSNQRPLDLKSTLPLSSCVLLIAIHVIIMYGLTRVLYSTYKADNNPLTRLCRMEFPTIINWMNSFLV